MKRFTVGLCAWLLLPAGAAFSAGIDFHDATTLLETVHVSKIIQVHTLEDIKHALDQARAQGLKISIAGARHAQGGQQSYANSLVLDMTGFNKIISLDHKNKIIRVQSGVTWKQIQDYIRPFHEAVQVMQTANIFTIGGSLSSNVHGKDPRFSGIIATVKSFHLMQANGTLINVSRQENPELFSLVIGGYGLFGIITDVDLELTDDVFYKEKSFFINYREYPAYFQAHILNNPLVGWQEAFFVKSRRGYLKTLRVKVYTQVPYDATDKTQVSRSKLMDIGFKNNDKIQTIEQEYFIPLHRLADFVDGLRPILHSWTGVSIRPLVLRFIRQDKESFLPYAKSDSFAFPLIMMTSPSLSTSEFKKIQDWTKQATDLSLNCGGTFYLTKIAVYPEKQELLKAYPEFNEFIKLKEKYDPQEIFMNQFYDHYRSMS